MEKKRKVGKKEASENEGFGMECEDNSCMGIMKVVWRNGLKNAECNRWKKRGRNTVFQESEALITDALDDI